MAKILDRIDAQLRVERDEFVAAELLAKKAAYLGRIGQADQAREIIHFVRQTFNDGRSGRVTCLILLAEAILLYHAFQNAQALDKFNRASLLAQGLRQPDLAGICAAWQGFIDFDLSRFESMQRSLQLIKDVGLDGDHAVQSRLAITLLTASILVGDRESERRWFQFGHAHAVADGDLACIDALQFNRAVFALARQRVAWCFDKYDSSWGKTIRSELDSARNLQNLVGITTMRDHIDLCVARLDLMEGRAQEAATKLASLKALDRFAGKHINEAALAIDLIYVRSLFDSTLDVARELNSLELGSIATLDPDERLFAMTLLDRLERLSRAEHGMTSCEKDLEAARLDYMEYEKRLYDSLQPWVPR